MQTGAALSFWTLKGKRKDEKQHSETARKRAWGKLSTQYFFSGEFPRNCNQDAGYWVSLATHTAPLWNPDLARAQDSLSGMWVLSEAVSKKGCLGFLQCWEIKKGFNTGHPKTHSREEAWQIGRRRGRREVVVFVRQMMGMLTPWLNEPWGTLSLPQRLQILLWWQWEGDTNPNHYKPVRLCSKRPPPDLWVDARMTIMQTKSVSNLS